MIAYNVVPSIAKLASIVVTAAALTLAVSAPSWAQQTVNSNNGTVVDGKGAAGNSMNTGYDWTNGAAYYEPHPRRINQSGACPSGSGRSSSCLHRQHHDRTGE